MLRVGLRTVKGRIGFSERVNIFFNNKDTELKFDYLKSPIFLHFSERTFRTLLKSSFTKVGLGTCIILLYLNSKGQIMGGGWETPPPKSILDKKAKSG